ncbi:MAG: hypothetical protein QM504_04285 [Pseudomonadota bacterium]
MNINTAVVEKNILSAIQTGKMIALIGRTGVGKSVLAKKMFKKAKHIEISKINIVSGYPQGIVIHEGQYYNSKNLLKLYNKQRELNADMCVLYQEDRSIRIEDSTKIYM